MSGAIRGNQGVVGTAQSAVDTMLGGMIGGSLGQYGSSVLSKYANNQEKKGKYRKISPTIES